MRTKEAILLDVAANVEEIGRAPSPSGKQAEAQARVSAILIEVLCDLRDLAKEPE